jgi:prepilin-type N-terminal cleavage/methylation domain-containing protein
MQKRGFTLVEMMVAIAVFSIVMVVAMSALVNVIDANHKAQAIKTAINNVNFALEGISKDMRMGTAYKCLNEEGVVIDDADCLSGGYGIRYRSPRAFLNGSIRDYAYYLYDGQQITSCLEKKEEDDCSNGPFLPITSTEVDITNMRFYLLDGEGSQPYVIITLSGTAGAKDKIQTTFDLQTSVSQRIRE